MRLSVSAAVGLSAEGPVLTLVGVGDVEAGVSIGFEGVEALMVIVPSKGGEFEGGEVLSSVECFVERAVVRWLCQGEEGRGGCCCRSAFLSFLCASFVLAQ
jgi:hypothetical protein